MTSTSLLGPILASNTSSISQGPSSGFASNGGGAAAGGGLEGFGNIMGIAGAAVQAIGAFYQAKNQQFQLESEALSLDFQQSIANINARAAELDAQAILEAGRRERALTTLQAGAAKSAQLVGIASRGVQAGVGSAAEIQASSEFAKLVDAYTIDANAFRAATAARRTAVNERTRADLAGVSASNLRLTKGSLRPGVIGASSLLGSAGGVARNFSRSIRANANAGGGV